jgi:hypothetical protein
MEEYQGYTSLLGSGVMKERDLFIATLQMDDPGGPPIWPKSAATTLDFANGSNVYYGCTMTPAAIQRDCQRRRKIFRITSSCPTRFALTDGKTLSIPRWTG